MNAAGYTVELTCAGQKFCFENVTYGSVCRIEDTHMADGSLYRVRSAGTAKTISLKGRVPFGRMQLYNQLIDVFSRGKVTFTLNGTIYADWTLLSGKMTVPENEQFAVCEIIITKVSK